MTLKEINDSLATALSHRGYQPRKQNVSIGITVNGYDVDLVPAKRHDRFSDDHSFYRRRADTWMQTNVTKHINLIAGSGRTEEIRIIKLWRKQRGLEFLSFCLELTVLDALRGKQAGDLANNVWEVFGYLRDKFPNVRVVDPANTNNVISDDLTVVERRRVAAFAAIALGAKHWSEIVR